MQQHATESLSKALATCREVLEYVGGASAAQPEAAPLEFSRQEWHNLRMNCLLALSKVASCQLSNYIERHHHELVMLIVSYCILLYLIVQICQRLVKDLRKVEPEEPLLDPEELLGLIPEDNSKVRSEKVGTWRNPRCTLFLSK